MIYIPVILGAILIVVGTALIIGHIFESNEMGRPDTGPKRPTFNITYPGIILIVIGAVMVIVGR
jgi:hypothetical protein